MTEREAVVAFLREEQMRFEAEANDELRRWGLSNIYKRLSGQALALRIVSDHLIGREVVAPADNQRAEDRDE